MGANTPFFFVRYLDAGEGKKMGCLSMAAATGGKSKDIPYIGVKIDGSQVICGRKIALTEWGKPLTLPRAFILGSFAIDGSIRPLYDRKRVIFAKA